MTKYKFISPEQKAYVQLLRDREKLSVRKIADIVEISKSSVWRILKGTGVKTDSTSLGRGKGRPEKLTARHKRLILRELLKLRKSHGNVTVQNIMSTVQLDRNIVSQRTVSRFLNKCGYRYLQARKKGLLLASDLKKRLRFARDLKQEKSSSFWTNEIAFYFDATGFEFKRHPKLQAQTLRGRLWRKKNEGLHFGCTAKGRKGREWW